MLRIERCVDTAQRGEGVHHPRRLVTATASGMGAAAPVRRWPGLDGCTGFADVSRIRCPRSSECPLPLREQTDRYRPTGAGSGMVQAEMPVPPMGRPVILIDASGFQHEARSDAGAELEKLHDEAVRRFGAQCLWSASPSRTPDGMLVVADRLRRYGGMDAWALAARIRKVLARAS